jgi:hypothetical protein
MEPWLKERMDAFLPYFFHQLREEEFDGDPNQPCFDKERYDWVLTEVQKHTGLDVTDCKVRSSIDTILKKMASEKSEEHKGPK